MDMWPPGGRLQILGIFAIVGTLAASAVSAAERPGPPNAKPAPAVASAQESGQVGGYVGDETCLTCHDGQDKTLKTTMHGKAGNPRTPAANRGCESCHGPGQAHVEKPEDPTSIKKFTTMAPRDVSETCLTCHARGTHTEWKGSAHDGRNLSCITCHSVHTPKSAQAQLKTATTIATCATCHRQQVMKLQRANHMPVREGKMDCTSCHNPHGSTNVKQLKVGNYVNEACYSCHAEKRGPFLWDHAAGRESCTTCHDPHGTSNDRLLVAKVPMLCQRCHIGSRHPSTIYDANLILPPAPGQAVDARSQRVLGRACVNCHQQIHGSNHPAGNTFLR